ncbi:glycosyl transferase family 39 [Acidobacteriota bacterium]
MGVCVVLVLLSLLPGLMSSGGKNLHVHQAKSFLEGRLDIPRYLHDAAVFKGRYYVPFPPFPAVLLLPFVALFGIKFTNTVLIGIALAVLSFLVLRRILGRLNIAPQSTLWILAAFFGGTAYWFCLVRSTHVWFFSHILAVTCILLAINEVMGRGRGFLAGCFLGMAFLSRQLTIYSVIFLLALLWYRPEYRQNRDRNVNIIMFFIPVLLCLGVYFVYNWVRFENILDTGYYHIYAGADYLSAGKPDLFLKERVEKYGLFHPAYVPFNFIHMFVQGFRIEFNPPNFLGAIRMNPFGTSLTFASPFVFAALIAKWRKSHLWAAWLSIGLTVITLLFYHTNGWRQVNAYRYTLDFLPLLVLLAAMGINRVKPIIWKTAIAYSIGLNILAIGIYHFTGK